MKLPKLAKAMLIMFILLTVMIVSFLIGVNYQRDFIEAGNVNRLLPAYQICLNMLEAGKITGKSDCVLSQDYHTLLATMFSVGTMTIKDVEVAMFGIGALSINETSFGFIYSYKIYDNPLWGGGYLDFNFENGLLTKVGFDDW